VSVSWPLVSPPSAALAAAATAAVHVIAPLPKTLLLPLLLLLLLLLLVFLHWQPCFLSTLLLLFVLCHLCRVLLLLLPLLLPCWLPHKLLRLLVLVAKHGGGWCGWAPHRACNSLGQPIRPGAALGCAACGELKHARLLLLLCC
jgi:hypothetical protein